MLPHVINHLTEYISQFVSRGPHNAGIIQGFGSIEEDNLT
jgi:hypothetical protein